MHQALQTRLESLARHGVTETLRDIRRGIEKEGLRTTPDGELAQTAHPTGLGSALTHPAITTDFSEALLEFVTPVMDTAEGAIEYLKDLHSFTYDVLEGELIWATSMPCFIGGEDSIPVARYGSSNVAMMKHVYRVGLANRYGKTMQTIAGIHYNFSLPDSFWSRYSKAIASPLQGRDFSDQQYFSLIRNFRRYSWLLLLLFGASPAVCGSFVRGLAHKLEPKEDKGYYLPWATSLRMGDLGYTSDAQSIFRVNYNSIDTYVETLGAALDLRYEPYEKIGVKKNGEYQQLNDRLLQIENEYYSDIRPKRVTPSGQHPLDHLEANGVQYIEIRNLDINPFLPVGIDTVEARFVDAFLVYCLLTDSPEISDREYEEHKHNKTLIINEGRKPGLALTRDGKPVSVEEWANHLLEGIVMVAETIDQAHDENCRQQAVKIQQAKLDDLQKTPSAQVLAYAESEDLNFKEVGRKLSMQHKTDLSHGLSDDKKQQFANMAKESLDKQRALETSDSVDFDTFLDNYFGANT